MYSKLQYISQGNSSEEQLRNIKNALDAGCDWIQLRFKNATEKEFAELALQVKQLCTDAKATFVINDNVLLAKEIDADGVHVGLNDMPVEEARKILGPDKIIGGTANTLDHVLQRVNEKCDYVGLGPFRFTATKEKLSPILGTEGYSLITNELQKRNIEIPVYAIGGIVAEDIETIMSARVHGIAVSAAITNSPNKHQTIKQINSRLYEYV